MVAYIVNIYFSFFSVLNSRKYTANISLSDYSWQWAYREKYKEAGITGLLGTGFDPGVTSVFTAYAQKHYFDEIHTKDILDCNGGDHGYPFATNFNPEIYSQY